MNFFDKYFGISKGRKRHPAAIRSKRIRDDAEGEAREMKMIGDTQDVVDDRLAESSSEVNRCSHYYVAILGTKRAAECVYCEDIYDPNKEL